MSRRYRNFSSNARSSSSSSSSCQSHLSLIRCALNAILVVASRQQRRSADRQRVYYERCCYCSSDFSEDIRARFRSAWLSKVVEFWQSRSCIIGGLFHSRVHGIVFSASSLTSFGDCKLQSTFEFCVEYVIRGLSESTDSWVIGGERKIYLKPRLTVWPRCEEIFRNFPTFD